METNTTPKAKTTKSATISRLTEHANFERGSIGRDADDLMQRLNRLQASIADMHAWLHQSLDASECSDTDALKALAAFGERFQHEVTWFASNTHRHAQRVVEQALKAEAKLDIVRMLNMEFAPEQEPVDIEKLAEELSR